MGRPHRSKNRQPMGKKGSRVATTNRKTQRWQASHQVDRRHRESRGQPVDANGKLPFFMAFYGGGLCLLMIQRFSSIYYNSLRLCGIFWVCLFHHFPSGVIKVKSKPI